MKNFLLASLLGGSMKNVSLCLCVLMYLKVRQNLEREKLNKMKRKTLANY